MPTHPRPGCGREGDNRRKQLAQPPPAATAATAFAPPSHPPLACSEDRGARVAEVTPTAARDEVSIDDAAEQQVPPQQQQPEPPQQQQAPPLPSSVADGLALLMMRDLDPKQQVRACASPLLLRVEFVATLL